MNKLKKNAVIMAAGTSSRFAPISYERPKALIEVRGEVLIERQIKQLKDAGIDEIVVVTGYKHEMFSYLKDKYGVTLIHNPEYEHRNNNASLYLSQDYIENTYICSADNYFTENPFLSDINCSYYSAVYSDKPLNEWFLEVDENDRIREIEIQKEKGWYMLGPAYFDADFSHSFLKILNDEYSLEKTKSKLWESIYMDHLDELDMKILRFKNDVIYEFDTLDELREFDENYFDHAESDILNLICKELSCKQSDLTNFKAIKHDSFEASGFCFMYHKKLYEFDYKTKKLKGSGE